MGQNRELYVTVRGLKAGLGEYRPPCHYWRRSTSSSWEKGEVGGWLRVLEEGEEVFTGGVEG